MARRKRTNPHELQAKWSLLLAIAAGLSMLLLIAGVFRHFSFAEFTAYYAEGSLRFYGIIATTLFSLAASGIGLFVALNGGQRRNALSGLAWMTFFIHALIIAVTLCVFIVFYFAREEVVRAT